MDLLEVNYKRPQKLTEEFLTDYKFPNERYKHWQFGEEYEELARKFPERMTPITDRIISPNPVVVYCLDGKTWTEPINNK